MSQPSVKSPNADVTPRPTEQLERPPCVSPEGDVPVYETAAGVRFDGTGRAAANDQDAPVWRVIEQYQHPTFDPSADAWTTLFANGASRETPCYVVEIAQLHAGGEAKAAYDRYVSALRPAIARARGEVLKVCDVVMPGTGDLAHLAAYAGGTAILVRYPSRRAYLSVLLDDAVIAAQQARRAALADVTLLVAGKDTTPALARLLFGKERPASDFKTPSLDGKSPQAIVQALLAAYPDGGADPSRAQLEQMVHLPGFAERPVFFINLYAFDQQQPEQGAERHIAYNRAAARIARAHGAHPYLRAPVEQVLIGSIPWSLMIFVRWPSLRVFTDLRLDPTYIAAQRFRVIAAQTYGNFVTFDRTAI